MPETVTPELELLRGDVVVRVVRLRAGQLTIGRAMTNHVILTDEDVSANHAVVALGPDGLRVRDLRSTNGTFVNGERVASDAPLAHGDLVRVGSGCCLRVRSRPPETGAVLAVADLTAGTVHLIEGDRFVIGRGEHCHLELPSGPRFAASLTVGNGEVWLDAEPAGRAIAPGETFEAGGHRFRLEGLERNATRATLNALQAAPFDYALWVSLDAPGGPVARLRDPERGIEHTVQAENRATVLYLLGRRRKEELDRGVPPALAGWIDDEDVLVGVWGRAAMMQATSNWSVLLHRLRKEIDDAGFDPAVLEKRRGAVRIRLRDITLAQGA